MRAEAISWDDWSVSNPPPIADDDKWHVEFEPNEVKIVSLEQLDDLFRLSIVDSETKVWQAGMSDWQPLRVIAGLDEAPAPQPRRAPPKPPTRAASPSVRPAAPTPHLASSSVRPRGRASVRPASPSVRPAPPAPRSAPPPATRPAYVAPASFYPEPIQAAPSAYPPAVAYAAPIAFAATMPATNSVRPLVVSHAPPIARGGGGLGRFLVVARRCSPVSASPRTAMTCCSRARTPLIKTRSTLVSKTHWVAPHSARFEPLEHNSAAQPVVEALRAAKPLEPHSRSPHPQCPAAPPPLSARDDARGLARFDRCGEEDADSRRADRCVHRSR